MSFTGPLFIVGMPRSGTKLVRGLLNQHPSIGIPNVETHFLPYWANHWTEFGDLSDQINFSRFYRQAINLPYFIFMRDIGEIIQGDVWYKNCENFGISGVFEALIRHDANVPVGNDKIWGDKTPSYIIHIPFLKKLFPNAKFIHIVRDVRDYSLSINRAWGKNVVRATDRWVDRINTFRKSLDDYGNDILELKYEDLLQDTENELNGICDFLTLEFDKRMLKLAKPCENLGDTQGEKTIVKSNRQKFLTEMPFKQRRSLERIAKPLLLKYGYPLEYKGPAKRVSKLLMLAYQIIDGINLVRYETKNRGLLKAIKFQWELFRTSQNA